MGARHFNEHGQRIGESHPRAKWPDATVREVLSQRDAGRSIQWLSVEFGVPYETIRGWCRCRYRAQIPRRIEADNQKVRSV